MFHTVLCLERSERNELNMEEKIKNKNIIEIIYQGEEKILDEKIKQANKKIRNQIKEVNVKELIFFL